MKIVGLGLPKTGTKTLGECCRSWGLRHQSWELDCFTLLLEKEMQQIMRYVEKFDSFDDCPWYLLYREIDARFPGSKFILTRRTSADVWFDSYCQWADKFISRPAHQIRKHVFGYLKPHRHKKEYIKTYLAHNAAVKAYFRNKPNQLLEVCWEEDDGWQALSDFLGYDIPNAPFPHKNKGGQNKIEI